MTALDYQPMARAIARGFHWQGADREDVQQEAVYALLEAERRWDRRGSFVSFARACIHRHLIDCLRIADGRDRRKPYLVAVEDDFLADLRMTEPLEVTVANRERLRLVHQLPDREKAVLGLAAQGYPYDEIGERLELSPAVVKWTAWRARSRLRDLEEAA